MYIRFALISIIIINNINKIINIIYNMFIIIIIITGQLPTCVWSPSERYSPTPPHPVQRNRTFTVQVRQCDSRKWDVCRLPVTLTLCSAHFASACIQVCSWFPMVSRRFYAGWIVGRVIFGQFSSKNCWDCENSLFESQYSPLMKVKNIMRTTFCTWEVTCGEGLWFLQRESKEKHEAR